MWNEASTKGTGLAWERYMWWIVVSPQYEADGAHPGHGNMILVCVDAADSPAGRLPTERITVNIWY